MGLRCSLFGHAFEEPVTERDRETRGAEVLISVREVRRCSRCGAEQVIAENTEIRHLGSADGDSRTGPKETRMAERLEAAEEPEAAESPDDEVEADATAPDVEVDEPDAEGTEDISKFVDSAEEPEESATPAEGPTDDASAAEEPGDNAPSPQEEDVEIIDDSEGSEPADAADSGEPDPSPGADTDTAEPAVESDGEVIDDSAPEQPSDTPQETEPESPEEDEEAVTDDAIILDNDSGEEERKSDIGRRELAGTGNMFDPSAPEDDASSSRESPDSELTDYYESSAERTEDESTPSEISGSEDTAEERDHAPWPDEEGTQSGSDDPGFQFGPEMQQDESAPETSDEPQKNPSGITTEGPVDVPGQADDTPPKAVVCPECGYETKGIGTSLRAGDICPDCHNGYLAERR